MLDIQELPLFKSVFDLLRVFNNLRGKMPKASRYTLGGRIEDELLGMLVDIMEAGRVQKQIKNPILERAMRRNDTLKVLFRLAGATDVIPEKEYHSFQASLQQCGSMLGGWRRKSMQ